MKIFTILIGAILLVKKRLRQKLPVRVQTYGAVVLIAASAMVFMAIFPPVTAPWWGPSVESIPDLTGEAMPGYAFIMDGRFDASKTIPEFAVNKSMLIVQWILTGVVATIICLLAAQRQKKSPI